MWPLIKARRNKYMWSVAIVGCRGYLNRDQGDLTSSETSIKKVNNARLWFLVPTKTTFTLSHPNTAYYIGSPTTV